MMKIQGKTVILFLLIIGALLGNYLNIPLFMGGNILCGSIFLIIIVSAYNPVLGVAAALAAGSLTYFLWGHFYGIIILTGEILFIALVGGNFKNKRAQYGIFLIDAMYWIFFGFPLVWLFYQGGLGLDNQVTMVVALKYSFNGLFNAIAASIVLSWVMRKQENKSTLQEAIFLLSVSIFLVSILSLFIYQSMSESDRVRKEASAQMEAEYKYVSEYVESWFRGCYQNVNSLAELSRGKKLRSSPELADLTKSIMMNAPYFYSMSIADNKGETLASYPVRDSDDKPGAGFSFADRYYFQELITTGQPVISEVFAGGESDRKAVITINIPIKDGYEIAGFAQGALNLEKAGQFLRSLERTSEVTILDKTGHVVFSSGRHLPLEEYALPRNEETSLLTADISQHKPLSIGSELDIWTRSYYRLERPLENLPWRIVVESRLSTIQERIYDQYIIGFLIILGIGVGMFFLTRLLSKTIGSSIADLCRITASLPRSISSFVARDWPVSNIYELDQLINNIKEMSFQLGESFQEIETKNKQLEKLVNYDPLTGIFNRRYIIDTIKSLIQAESSQFAVAFLDLDNFKYINDSFGHEWGDSILKEIAVRLQVESQNRYLIARYGGDEFLLLFESIDEDRVEFYSAVQRISAAVAEPIYCQGYAFIITCSIGVAFYPDDAGDVDSLVNKANTAMHYSKENGKDSCAMYSPVMNRDLKERIVVGNHLRQAIQGNELEVFYQPIYNLHDSKILGAEALLRWKSAFAGYISPEVFIPVAEETGLINKLGEWVLDKALRQAKQWQDGGYPLWISVNFSPKQFQMEGFEKVIFEMLEKTGVNPHLFQIEITENVFFKNVPDLKETLQHFKDRGIRIVLDDFGTGYSSLKYLKELPIDVVKIDRSFTRNIAAKETRAIIKTIISLAHYLDMEVIAEGIETKEQEEFYISNNCDYAQGFAFCKPVPPETMLRVLQGDIYNFLAEQEQTTRD